MKKSEFRQLIREEIRKVIQISERVKKAELKNMKASVGYVALEGPSFDIPEDWPSYIDVEYVSFEEGANEVLEFAKNYDASPKDLKELEAKLQKLKTMGTKFVSYSFESDVNIGVL